MFENKYLVLTIFILNSVLANCKSKSGNRTDNRVVVTAGEKNTGLSLTSGEGSECLNKGSGWIWRYDKCSEGSISEKVQLRFYPKNNNSPVCVNHKFEHVVCEFLPDQEFRIVSYYGDQPYLFIEKWDESRCLEFYNAPGAGHPVRFGDCSEEKTSQRFTSKQKGQDFVELKSTSGSLQLDGNKGLFVWGNTHGAKTKLNPFPDYANITTAQECVSNDEYFWNSEESACYPEYMSISNEDDCLRKGSGWIWRNDKCREGTISDKVQLQFYPKNKVDPTCINHNLEHVACRYETNQEFKIISYYGDQPYSYIAKWDESKCLEFYNAAGAGQPVRFGDCREDKSSQKFTSQQKGDEYIELVSTSGSLQLKGSNGLFVWGNTHNAKTRIKPFPDYANIATADTCTGNEGYLWNSEDNICYPAYGGITNEVECISIAGYAWNSEAGICQTDEQYCESLEVYIWADSECLQRTGASGSVPSKSCKLLLDKGFATEDGVYWLDPNAGDPSDAFQAYCDMTTDGGGWVLIASTNGSSADMPVGELSSQSESGMFSQTRTQDLGTVSSQVRISNLTGWKVISIAESFPIQQVRVYKRLHDNASKSSPDMYWTGNISELTHNGVQSFRGTYLNEIIYQTNGQSGLHLSARQGWSRFWRQPTENFNVWVK